MASARTTRFLPRNRTKPSSADIVAGVSVALVAIPQSLAYAELAGLPAQYGLYAAGLPLVVAAAFVSSRFLQTGPAALTALLSFGILSTLAEPRSADYIALAATLALLVGLLRAAFGLLRLGSVSYLLAEPVLLGFTSGAAILILASQTPKALGVSPGHHGVLSDAAEAVVQADLWSPASLAFSASAAALVVVGRRIHPLFPGVLIAVVGAVIVSAAVGYDGNRVGDLDVGLLPPFRLAFSWTAVPDLLPGALAIAVIGFAEPASIARTYAAADRQPWNANKELFSQGAANVASALSGGFPVGGSFARSALGRLAGAKSPWAGAVTGLVVLVALPLVPLLAPLPSAVLGAVVIIGVVGLIRVRSLIELIQESLVQGIVAVGTLVATLAFAPRVERGVLVGVGLAIAAHLYREVAHVSVDTAVRGTALRVRPTGVVWFVTAPEVERRIELHVAENPHIEHLQIDLSGVGRLDYTGAAILARMAENLTDAGLTVEVVRIPATAARSVDVHLGRYATGPTRTDDVGSSPARLLRPIDESPHTKRRWWPGPR